MTDRRLNVRIRFLDDSKATDTVVLPVSALRLLLILTDRGQGNAVTVMFLNNSRHYVVKLLDEEKIPQRTALPAQFAWRSNANG